LIHKSISLTQGVHDKWDREIDLRIMLSGNPITRAASASPPRPGVIASTKPTLVASAIAGKRFLRAAQAMAAVEHDPIVRVHEVAEECGNLHLRMEFLRGEPLGATSHLFSSTVAFQN
jgi:hypothetical protein